MYIALYVIPVPEANKDAYLHWAKYSADVFRRYGCLDVIDGWEDFVPAGTHTDYFRAVNAQPGEKIVCSLQVWPDKAQFYAAEAKMHDDDALEFTDASGEPPFDASRLIVGCFSSIQRE
jgi:uncharacterized protein YbaA (DUF1428 family)